MPVSLVKAASLSDYFDVLPKHRVCIVGKTDSGKTMLAKRMVQEFNSVLILDFKHTIRIPGIEITDDPKKLSKLGIDFPHIIFRVPLDWDATQLDNLFKWAFERGETLVYIDEGYSVGSASSFPRWLKIIAVQGREKRVALWTLFQRPRGVPVFLVSEAEHLFVFYLSRPEDREYIEQMAETQIDWAAIAPKITELPDGRKKVENSHMFFHIRLGAGANGPYRMKLKDVK